MDFKIEKYNENFMSFRTPARYTYNIDILQNVYRVQLIPKKRTRKRLLKKPLCSRYQRESHPILKCSEVKSLYEKCTMFIRTLTLEQIEEVQEIIFENFLRGINNEQLSEALEFTLEVVENIIRNDIEEKEKEIEYLPLFIKVFPQEARPIELWQKRKNSIEAFDPYYAIGKFCDIMQDQDLDNLIPKSRKDEPRILGNYNRNSIIVPAPKKPSKWPRTRPTIAEVLDTYSVPDKPEKKSSRDVALGLGIDLKPLQALLNEYDVTKTELDELCQKNKMKLENVPEDVIGGKLRSAKEKVAKKNVNPKAAEVDIESPVLPYNQKTIKAVETDHVIGTIKPGFKNRMETEKEASREYQRSETKLDRKEEVVDKEDLEKNDCKTLVEGDVEKMK
ncbi:hypothetical protein C2G38_2274797 [Gigaspora rosea]|uniref:Uncharacterized protein n=1 Tax=Gigaspora rosea TaxID=44941 RepID=A0A397UAD8_9GLOM|nr:hypothetical protein C2G38_2274797 [Gigaspora rosea]